MIISDGLSRLALDLLLELSATLDKIGLARLRRQADDVSLVAYRDRIIRDLGLAGIADWERRLGIED